jgi:hypothetical protein
MLPPRKLLPLNQVFPLFCETLLLPRSGLDYLLQRRKSEPRTEGMFQSPKNSLRVSVGHACSQVTREPVPDVINALAQLAFLPPPCILAFSRPLKGVKFRVDLDPRSRFAVYRRIPPVRLASSCSQPPPAWQSRFEKGRKVGSGCNPPCRGPTYPPPMLIIHSNFPLDKPKLFRLRLDHDKA